MKISALIAGIAATALLAACSGGKKSYDTFADNGLTQRTENMRQHLLHWPDSTTIVGQHYATLTGIGWQGDSARSDMKDVCGDYPAATSYDIGGIAAGEEANADGLSFDDIRRDALWHYDRGHLIRMYWEPQHGASADKLAGWLATIEDGYGRKAPIVLAVPRSAAALAAQVRDKATNIVLALTVPAAEAGQAKTDGISDGIFDIVEYDCADDSTACRTIKPHTPCAIVAGIRGAGHFRDVVLPLVQKLRPAYVIVPANIGEPYDRNFYVPYPGSDGADDFISFYNDKRTIFARQLNGLYL